MKAFQDMTMADIEAELKEQRGRDPKRQHQGRIAALARILYERKKAAAAWEAETNKDAAVDRGCMNKKRYGTPEAAGVAAASRIAQGAEPLRVYPCRYCGDYHLTKSSLEGYVAAVDAS